MRPTGMVTGVAEDWPGVGIHSNCAEVTESIPWSFLYDAGTDGRLIRSKLTLSPKGKSTKIFKVHSAKTRAYVITTSLFGSTANPSLSSQLYVE